MRIRVKRLFLNKIYIYDKFFLPIIVYAVLFVNSQCMVLDVAYR